MPCCGEVYYDNNFKYSDNKTGKKLFIVLTNSEPFLVLKTTSQNKIYTDVIPYCNPAKFVFFIPTILKEIFEEDTYIQLNEIFPYSGLLFTSPSLRKEIKLIGSLKDSTCNSLLNCIKKLKDDVSPEHYNQLFN